MPRHRLKDRGRFVEQKRRRVALHVLTSGVHHESHGSRHFLICKKKRRSLANFVHGSLSTFYKKNFNLKNNSTLNFASRKIIDKK